jgi:hypothetical protein
MRRIGLVLVLVVMPFASYAEQEQQRQSKEFPGGVQFVERIDAMTDKRLCSVHTPMRGIEAVASGGSVAFFVHERLGPVVPSPAPSLRLRQSKPIDLTTTDRPYLIAVPQDRARETIEALYMHSRIVVRWYDLRRDEHTMTVETGDFGAAYDHAVTTCAWPRLSVKRGTFVSRPATQSSPPDVRGGIEGESVSLDSSDPAYSGYLERVRRMIKEKWGYPCVTDAATGHCEYKNAEVRIEFGILRDGRLAYVTVSEPSALKLYNDYAAIAIRMSQPFPPAPPELMARAASGSPGVRIVATFTYVFEGGSLRNELR